MKRICASVLMLAVCFAAAACHAADDGTPTSTTISDQTMKSIIIYNYNKYGDMVSSTQSTTIMTTTVDDEGNTSTQVQHSVTTSKIIAGSVKPVETNTTFQTTSDDGTVLSKGTAKTTYTYDSDGHLSGASGWTKSDSFDDKTGKLASHVESNDTYKIVAGEAQRVKSTVDSSKSFSYDKDGTTKLATISGYTNYEYTKLAGGSYVLSKEVSHNVQTPIDSKKEGATTQVTDKTKTYVRSSNGALTDIKLSGTMKLTVSASGGTQTYTRTLLQPGDTYKTYNEDGSVKATKTVPKYIGYDPDVGYYIKAEYWSEVQE